MVRALVRQRAYVIALGTGVAFAACSERPIVDPPMQDDTTSIPTPPVLPPGKAQILNESDSAAHTPAKSQILRIRAIRADGYPDANAAVSFVPLPRIRFGAPSVTISYAATPTRNEPYLLFSTDANGYATAVIHRPATAGIDSVNVTIGTTHTSLNIPIVTIAGPARGIQFKPSNGVNVLNRPFVLTATSYDEFNNPRDDTFTFSSNDPGLVVNADGSVVANRTGTFDITATVVSPNAETLASATTSVWIVPEDEVIWQDAAGNIFIGSLANATSSMVVTGASRLTATTTQPNADRFLFRAASSSLFVYDIPTHAISASAVNPTACAVPEFSRDAVWLYYPARANGTSRIYRSHIDGSEVQLITPSDSGTAVTVSPEGRSIAYASGLSIKIMELSSGAVRTVAVNSKSIFPVGTPRWSPDGSAIAYLEDPHSSGVMSVVRIADGSKITFTSPMGGFDDGFSWSRDSKLILAHSVSSGYVINASNGEMRYIAWLGFFPEWKR